MTKPKKCHECGGAMRKRVISRTVAVGGRKVTDGSTATSVCEACGAYELSHAAMVKSERRAAMIVLTDCMNVEGSVLRYARKALGLTQAQLARALDTSPETVSRWETGSLSITRQTQLAVAHLLTRAGDDPDGFEHLVNGGGDERMPRSA